MVRREHFKEMIVGCNRQLTAPCRSTESRIVKIIQELLEVSMRNLVWDIPFTASATIHASPSCVYKGHSAFTMYWMDRNWGLRRVRLDFQIFSTPHCRENTSTLLFNLLSKSNLQENVWVVTTDNASNMSSAITKLIHILSNKNNKMRPVTEIHVRFIEHGVNLHTLDFLNDVHVYVNQIYVLVQRIWAFVKQREICDFAREQF